MNSTQLLWLSILLLCAAAAVATFAFALPQTPAKTQIVLLGTGTPNADPDRFGPSIAIVVNDTPYLVDFGPGVVRRASAAVRKGVKGLAMPKLTRAFVTHLHSDHTVGYADLIFTPWVLERTEPLEVYGPKGLRTMTEHIVKAYRQDLDMRLYGLEPSNKTGHKVNAHEIKPGVIYKDANVTVKAFAVKHGSWKEAFGFRFETPDKTIVISGDCAPSQSVVDACQGCDVLLHEVYSQTGFQKRPPEWQKYHSQFHTSSRELAEIATKAKPGLLILYHQLFWGTSEEDLLNEIRQGYSGKVVSGRDLDVY
ncbi:MAG TPA: MBL fold metallo-hydrolase [Blastocatellia bacterium]|nr:MBL fold metallo-hydrolase [Blastocatellia bacterium]